VVEVAGVRQSCVRQDDVRGAGAGRLTSRYGRRTRTLQAVLKTVALALSGRTGRPADRQGGLSGEPVNAAASHPRRRRPG
jgi:hypothetical protein